MKKLCLATDIFYPCVEISEFLYSEDAEHGQAVAREGRRKVQRFQRLIEEKRNTLHEPVVYHGLAVLSVLSLENYFL